MTCLPYSRVGDNLQIGAWSYKRACIFLARYEESLQALTIEQMFEYTYTREKGKDQNVL